MTYVGLCGAGLERRSWGTNPNLEIDATSENLQKAIREQGIDVLHYQFKETKFYSKDTYTAIEYAIKIGDVSSLQTLIALRSSRFGPYQLTLKDLFFYLDCLRESTSPKCEMLHFLLSNISNINETDPNYFSKTPLEYAMHMMGVYYTNPHWAVIEILLQKGAYPGEKDGLSAPL